MWIRATERLSGLRALVDRATRTRTWDASVASIFRSTLLEIADPPATLTSTQRDEYVERVRRLHAAIDEEAANSGVHWNYSSKH